MRQPRPWNRRQRRREARGAGGRSVSGIPWWVILLVLVVALLFAAGRLLRGLPG